MISEARLDGNLQWRMFHIIIIIMARDTARSLPRLSFALCARLDFTCYLCSYEHISFHHYPLLVSHFPMFYVRSRSSWLALAHHIEMYLTCEHGACSNNDEQENFCLKNDDSQWKKNFKISAKQHFWLRRQLIWQFIMHASYTHTHFAITDVPWAIRNFCQNLKFEYFQTQRSPLFDVVLIHEFLLCLFS